MTVEPVFGGQKFLDGCLPKIARTRQAISASGLEIRLQVDGGVAASTIERVVDAGADVLVAGSAVYGAEEDRKNTRLNSSHVSISYAVFCFNKEIYQILLQHTYAYD